MKINFRLGSQEREILKAVALGTLVLTSLALPGLPAALQPFLKQKGPKKFKRTLQNLYDKGVIHLGGEEVRLTKKGERLLRIIKFSELEIERPKKWDKIWRLVSYDIPDTSKKERDWFRWTLEKLGFIKVQESLWVFPFECKEEIAVIAQDLKISPHIIYMQTDHLPRQKQLERQFNLI